MLIPWSNRRYRGFGTTASGIDALSLSWERQTPEQIGAYLTPTRAIAAGATVTMRYRQTGNSTWIQAHPLLRIDPTNIESGAPETVIDAFAGSIFDLAPGVGYDVEFTLTEPGQPTKTLTTTRSTRAIPGTTGAANKTLTTAGNVQTTFDGLVAGDVLQLSNGTYTVSSLTLDVAGTSGSPIVIRGESRDGVIIKDTTGIVLQLLDASNIIIERLTIEGSSSDSGTSSSSQGIVFWGGAVQTNVTIRDVDLVGVDMGIVGDEMEDVLVYNCELNGNNLWNATNVGTTSEGSPNLTWNDDGIRIPGRGNCAWENTLTGFGDACAVIAGTLSAGVHFYRNRIPMTGDDACEADYATRNCSFYDNYITNSATLLSVDPVYGGPFYCHRNTAINTVRGPYKLNSASSGFLIYNNTILRTEGNHQWGWNQSNNGDLQNWAYRNNLLIYRGAGSGGLMAMESGGNDALDFDHNSWFPNESVWWTNSGGSFSSMANAFSGLGATTPVFSGISARHTGDVVSATNPFITNVTLGSDHLTQIDTEVILQVASGQAGKNAGAAIPGITDGYSGAAPDMGAIMEGRSVPTYGATRGWVPPYSVPTTVNTSTLIGSNTVNNAQSSAWSGVTPWYEYNLFSDYGGGIFNPYYDVAGAFHLLNLGGHGDGSTFDDVALQLIDETWGLRLNANGVASRTGSVGESETNGTPYFEVSSATSGQFPSPGHAYNQRVVVDQGSQGTVIWAGRSAVCSESYCSVNVFHKYDVASRLWTRIVNGTCPSYPAPASLGAWTEGSAVYDQTDGRVYNFGASDVALYTQIDYLRLSDNTIQTTAAFTAVGTTDGGKFFLSDAKRMILHAGQGGVLRGIDLTNIAGGFQTLTVSGSMPTNGANTWVWHPTNGKFYKKDSNTGNTLHVLTPPSGSGMSGTWTVSTVTIGGSGVPGRPDTSANDHYTNMYYIPALDLLGYTGNGQADGTALIKV